MQIAGNSSPDESHRGPTSYKYYVCSDIAANGDQDAGGKRNDEGELNWMRHVRRRLTVKLRGRAEAPDARRGRTLSPRARGAKPQALHGPLQRLLGVTSGPPFNSSNRLRCHLSDVSVRIGQIRLERR